MTGYTPGPWIARQGVDDDPNRWCVNVDGPMEWNIATIENGAPGDTLETEGHNARLIAEAGTVATETGLTPRQLAEQRTELLEALKGLVSIGWNDSPLVSVYAKEILEAEQAIVKAEGRGQP